MSEEITSALSREEWMEWQKFGCVERPGLRLHTKGRGFLGLQRVSITAPHPADVECHAIAAVCLYGQEFGFTREMSEAVHLASMTETAIVNPKLKEALEAAAARIAALLPSDGAPGDE